MLPTFINLILSIPLCQCSLNSTHVQNIINPKPIQKQNLKIWKKWFWRFLVTKNEGGGKKKRKNCQTRIFDFYYVAKKNRRMIKIFSFYLWLIAIFDFIFLGMITIVAKNQNSPTPYRIRLVTTCEVCSLFFGVAL